MRTTSYLNAKTVLPPGLLAEVQRHVHGHLWVPPVETQATATKRRVQQLHLAGLGSSEIAEMVQISQRRVQQIVRMESQEQVPHANR
jgi:hypothetical protein